MLETKKGKGHAGTILIVDDEPTIRDVLGSLLGEEGYRMDFAENGHDGYEKARELIPDLILLDVMMPVMDGFEACRRIRTEPPLAEVPIIMITAVGDDGSRARSIESGADDFISKPFDLDELLAKVKNTTKDNCLRELPPERESLTAAHEEHRDAHDAPVEGWICAPELRDTEAERHTRRDTGFTSVPTGTPGEITGDRTGGDISSPGLWRK